MSKGPHHLLLASAGTGKTFQLTNHYLRLLFKGVPAERVLATTFTRKAAGEILHRVLERLADAGESAQKLAELHDEVGIAPGSTQECRSLLAGLVRDIDRFQVRTLDSFFVHLARLFALDLELPHDWEIADEREDQHLRGEALLDLLGRGSRSERVEMLRRLQKEAASRSVYVDMLRAIDKAREVFLECEAGAWKAIEPEALLTEEELAARIEELSAMSLPLNKTGKPNKSWQDARADAVAALEQRAWQAFLEKGLGGKVLAGERTYYRHEINDDQLGILEPLVRDAVQRLLAELAAQNAATLQLLEHFEEAYVRLKRARGVYRFDDLPALLAPPSGELPLEERDLDLWFRLDGRIDHLLLDEFQDTSPPQWRILKPLVEELLADGLGERSFFCVGDVKQSIYGWRQAEPRLLGGLEARYPVLEAETMSKSFRSSAVILDTVNLLFGNIESNALFAAEDRAPLRRAAASWAGSFEPHSAARPYAGFARVVECRERGEEEGASDPAPLIERTVDVVRDILAQAPGVSIGVLLRKNKWIPRLIYSLREAGIPASGEGGNPLTDSEPVLACLSLLHLADHPEDTAASFHVGTSVLGPLVGLPVMAEDSQRHAAARDVRERLLGEGLGALCGRLFTELDAQGLSHWDRQRFAQLVDLAYAFEERADLRPSSFVEHVRREKVVAPSSARVRVMTIHASKGLEFEAVVLPDLCEPMLGRMGILSRRGDAAGWIREASNAPREALVAWHPLLRELYEHVKERAVEESLCVLYVAMTRAARRLEMIVRPAEEAAADKATYQSLLRAAIETQPPDEEGAIWRHPQNSPDWSSGVSEGLEEEPEPDRPGLVLAPSRRPRSRPGRSPSAEEGGGRARVEDLLRSRTAATRGTLVHAWLEELVWVEDFAIDERRMLEEAVAIEPDLGLRREAFALLEAALRSEAVRGALSREAFDAPAGATLEVHSEYPFRVLLDDEQGESALWTGSIDRLVVVREEDRVVAAEILDYKTDSVEGEELQRRAEHYRPQLEAYRRVVVAQTGLEPSAVRTRLLFLEAGVVV